MTNLEKNQSLAVVVQTIVSGVNFFQIILILKILSVYDYGLVGIVFSVSAIFGMVQHMGINSGTIREIAQVSGNRDISNTFIVALTIRIILVLPTALIFYLLIPYIANNIYKNRELVYWLKFLPVILVLKGTTGNYIGLLLGTLKYRLYYVTTLLNSALSAFFLISFTFIYGLKGYFIASLINIIVFQIIHLFIYSFVLRLSYRFPEKIIFSTIFKNIFSISIQVYLIKILNEIRNRGIVALLGAFLSVEITGQYYFALRISERFSVLVKSITTVSMPYFSKLFKKDIEKYWINLKKNYFSTVLITSVITIYLSCFLNDILNIYLGNKYYLGYKIIPILLVASYFKIIGQYLNTNVFVPINKIIVSVYINFISIAILLLSSFYLLVSSYSIISISFIILFSSIIFFIGHLLYIYFKQNKCIINMKLIFIILSSLLLPISGYYIETLVSNLLLFSILTVVIIIILKQSITIKIPSFGL